MKNLQKMSEKEFKEFLQESMTDCSGTDIGLTCTFEIDGKTCLVDVILTNYMIYQDWEKTDDYKKAVETYSKEVMDEYEELIYDSHTDTLRNRSLNLNLGGDDDLEEINQILIDYYIQEEADIDFKALYEARDEIQEAIEEEF